MNSHASFSLASAATGLLAACAGLAILPATPGHAAAEVYSVRATDLAATVGVKATTAVLFSTRQGWHLNAEAPFTLKLTPEAGLVVEKAKLTRADLVQSSEDRAYFEVVVTASQPGERVVRAEAGFVICQEALCRPVREKLAIRVMATVPALAPAKKAEPR